jgi:glutathione S-transferase
MIRLYDYPECLFAQKVKVVLAEKELEYETVAVDLRKGEQRQPEFLKLNPYGRVPVLIDDEVVVYDSTIINEYLEDEYPHPALMPEDSAGRAKIRLLEDFCDNSFLPSASFVLIELSKAEGEQDAERLQRYRTELQRGLARLETQFGGKEYLVGEYSIADIAFVPAVLILARLGVDVDPRLRQVAAWIGRLRQRPAVASLLGG